MEYLEGRDLAQVLADRGTLPPDEAVAFVLQACEAIAEAHGLGIVHRDLKPANLFCVRRADGLLSVKVLDFGISKMTPGASAKSDHKMTRTNAVLGSPFYMSPEQMRSSRDVDARSDIWSLGVILYQLVTGRMPFEAEAMPELVLKIADAAPPSMRTHRPDLMPAFEGVVMRCLEKDRQRRYANVGELALALYEYGPPRARGSVDRVMRTLHTAGLVQGVTPSRPEAPVVDASPSLARGVGAVTPAMRAPTMDSWGQTGSRAGSSRRNAVVAAVGVGVLLLAVGGVTTGILLKNRQPQAMPLEPLPASPAMATTPPAPTAADPAPSTLAPDPLAASSPPPSPSASAVATAAPLAVHPAAKPGTVHAVTTPPAKTAAPAKNCNPPYVIDAAGHRQYKPECL
jgi:serine/threonine-protein kinase